MAARTLFHLYVILYVMLYTGYLLFIYWIRPTLSMVSLSAIILPFIFLLIFQWFIWKRAMLKEKRKIKTQFFILSICCFSLVLWCGVLLGVNAYTSNFSSERWQDMPKERVYMVDDFVKQSDLLNMTREKIVVLLGEPTETEYFKEENNIVYYLGDERGLISIDSEWLLIFFNGNNEVVKYSIEKD